MSVDGSLIVFKDAAVDDLGVALRMSETAENFLAFLDQLAQPGSERLTGGRFSYGTELPVLAVIGSNGGDGDIVNAIALHQHLGEIGRVGAADRRLWTYLSTVTFRAYTAGRWPLDSRKWQNRVRDRWVILSPSKPALVRNALARLWWAVELTRDADLSRPLTAKAGDQYAYLRVLMGREDTFLALMDRDIAMIPDLLAAVLEHIDQRPELASEGYIRGLVKSVTLIAGYAEWAAMDEVELRRRLAEATSSIPN